MAPDQETRWFHHYTGLSSCFVWPFSTVLSANKKICPARPGRRDGNPTESLWKSHSPNLTSCGELVLCDNRGPRSKKALWFITRGVSDCCFFVRIGGVPFSCVCVWVTPPEYLGLKVGWVP